MTAPTPAGLLTESRPDQPPQHLVDLIAAVVHVDDYAHGPAGSSGYAAAAQRLAREYVTRIWAEGWHTGVAWHAARTTAIIQLDVSALPPEGAIRLADRLGEMAERAPIQALR